MPRSSRIVAAVAAAVVLLAACGGDDGADRQAYVDAAVTAIGAESDLELDDDDVACLAEEVVDAAGADELDAAGITPEELRAVADLGELGVEIDEDELARGVRGCEIDVGELLGGQLAASLGDMELSEEATSCISAELGDSELVADALVAGLLGDEEEAEAGGREAAIAAFGACVGAVVELFVASVEAQGLELSAEAEACIAEQIDERGDEVAEAFVAAADDAEAGRDLGVEIVRPCADLLPG